jgi:hypothetical protein
VPRSGFNLVLGFALSGLLLLSSDRVARGEQPDETALPMSMTDGGSLPPVTAAATTPVPADPFTPTPAAPPELVYVVPATVTSVCVGAYRQAIGDAYTAGLLVFAHLPGAQDPRANQALGDGCDRIWQRGWQDGYEAAARIVDGESYGVQQATELLCYFDPVDCMTPRPPLRGRAPHPFPQSAPLPAPPRTTALVLAPTPLAAPSRADLRTTLNAVGGPGVVSVSGQICNSNPAWDATAVQITVEFQPRGGATPYASNAVVGRVVSGTCERFTATSLISSGSGVTAIIANVQVTWSPH